MTPDATQAATLLALVGAEDFSDVGVEGVTTVQGPLGDALIQQAVPQWIQPSFMGKPVRVSRMGGLEIWCEGWYMEGRGVRRAVHAAVRSLSAMLPAPLPQESRESDAP